MSSSPPGRRGKRRFTPACGPITAPLSPIRRILSLVVEDEAGQIIGGCDAFRMGELALLDVLWVAESRRGTGLGACLLAQLEQDAARQGAKRLELNTFGFQAPGFYEKLGYRRFGAVEPAVGEYGHYFYVKEL